MNLADFSMLVKRLRRMLTVGLSLLVIHLSFGNVMVAISFLIFEQAMHCCIATRSTMAQPVILLEAASTRVHY